MVFLPFKALGTKMYGTILLGTRLNPFESCLFHPFYGKSLKYVFPCTVTYETYPEY